jgi:hypothetical protein
VFEGTRKLLLGLVLSVAGFFHAIDKNLAFRDAEFLHRPIVCGRTSAEEKSYAAEADWKPFFHHKIDRHSAPKCRPVGAGGASGERWIVTENCTAQ